MSTNKRIQWVDMAKGLAIILVIVGHTIGNPIIRGLIFSFHMPLFFILSGYTSKCPENKTAWQVKTKSGVQHLLLPAYIIYVIRIVLLVLIGDKKVSAVGCLLSMLFASGDKTVIAGIEIPEFGMMWFLVVLFGMKCLYEAISLLTGNKYMFIISLIVSTCGVLIGSILFLPFSFDLIMSTMLFFCIGQKLRSFELSSSPILKLLVSGAVWSGLFVLIFAISDHYLELAMRRYPLYPLCYVMAVSGCLTVFIVMIKLEKIKVITAVLSWFGKNSIYMFIVHAFDMLWLDLLKRISDDPPVLSVIRTAVDVIVLIVYVKVIKMIKSDKKVKSN